jgi:hypothetical protein
MDVWVPYQGSAMGLSGSDEIGAGSDPRWTTLEREKLSYCLTGLGKRSAGNTDLLGELLK